MTNEEIQEFELGDILADYVAGDEEHPELWEYDGDHLEKLRELARDADKTELFGVCEAMIAQHYTAMTFISLGGKGTLRFALDKLRILQSGIEAIEEGIKDSEVHG